MSSDWQEEHFSHRRIGHGRKSKGSTKARAFDPRSCFGAYQLQCPRLAKSANDSASNDKSDSAQGSLEIHGPVEDNDDALMCTLNFAGMLQGVAVLAGSRKVLSRVISEIEEETEEEEDESEDEGSGGHLQAKSSIELSDERERRRFEAFEKNSFRNPKFWIRWRAVVRNTAGNTGAGRTLEVNGGYLVFSGHDCASFSGTLTCKALGLKDAKFTGSKTVSKPTESQMGWLDVAVDDG